MRSRGYSRPSPSGCSRTIGRRGEGGRHGGRAAARRQVRGRLKRAPLLVPSGKGATRDHSPGTWVSTGVVSPVSTAGRPRQAHRRGLGAPQTPADRSCAPPRTMTATGPPSSRFLAVASSQALDHRVLPGPHPPGVHLDPPLWADGVGLLQRDRSSRGCTATSSPAASSLPGAPNSRVSRRCRSTSPASCALMPWAFSSRSASVLAGPVASSSCRNLTTGRGCGFLQVRLRAASVLGRARAVLGRAAVARSRRRARLQVRR
jgi:hypothetical protein